MPPRSLDGVASRVAVLVGDAGPIVSQGSASENLLSHIGDAMASHCRIHVCVIWEIGSRDGKDALELSRFHPEASVICFEPNPDTFHQVLENTSQDPNRSIRAFPFALCNSDGPVTFFKIDPIATKTTWPDGNPGASSLYLASGDYPVEEYVQVPVMVQGRRASSLIDEGIPSPHLIWMDVQGAELEVLKGFGDHLKSVAALHVELSLRQMYTGQALAPEAVALLANLGFRWHSVTRTGEWQFDALFLNAHHRTWRLNLRHFLLSRSLQTRRKLGIRKPLPTNPKAVWVRSVRRILRFLVDGYRCAIDHVLAKMPLSVATRWMFAQSEALRVRFEESKPSNPLDSSKDLPSIEVLIPCVARDAAIVSVALDSTAIGIVNPIERVVILAPVGDHQVLSPLMCDGVQLVSDEEQDLPRTFGAVEELVPPNRRGWVKQQVLKLGFVARSASDGVLVLDADTILLQPRVWLDKHRQILAVAHEYHLPYLAHTERCLGPYGIDEGISWVTHHQLMQPRIVRAMLGVILERCGHQVNVAETSTFEVDKALEAWVRSGDFTKPSAISEYHTYGAYLRRSEGQNCVVARWSNTAFSPSEIDLQLPAIARHFDTWLSASGHAYLKRT